MRPPANPLRTSRFAHALLLASLVSCAVTAPTCAAAGDELLPFVRLFDTREPLDPAAWASWEAAPAWEGLPEGELEHEFRGDAVVMNDKVAVLVRRGAGSVQLWSRAAGGPRRQALLGPLRSEVSPPAPVSALSIVENGPGAVMLDVAFETPEGKPASAGFRLTTGDLIAEVRPGPGTDGLAVAGQMRYVAVPDFFGDDVVFGPETCQGDRIGLPTENLFLSFLGEGDAILACTWRSPERNADVTFMGDGSERAISGCTVQCAPGESVWVACLEGAGIWHARALNGAGATEDIALSWQPPFPAKWRASFVRADGVADSWDFQDGRQEGYSRPGFAEMVYPCWLEGGRAYLRVPQPLLASRAGGYEAVVAYPLDRSRATPLTAFCAIDIMRNTLGVGPCQYILAMEGLGAEAHPTPADVTEWVERQFERGRDEQSSGAIKERLAAMVEHVSHTQQRLDTYAGFARQVRGLCESAGPGPSAGDTRSRLLSMADETERRIAVEREAIQSVPPAAELADAMAGLIGTANVLPEVQRIAAELRSIGAAQDEALARCRMTARRVKQACRMAAAGDARTEQFVREVQDLAEKILRPQ